MRPDVIVDIVYSAYIQDYFLYFTMLSLGYFVLVRFLGYIIGNIPFIQKIFTKINLLSYLLWLPILIGIYKVVLDIDNGHYFLEHYLFLIIFICISSLVFIYSGMKQVYVDFNLIGLVSAYKTPIIVILIISAFYANNYFTKNYNFIETKLRNKVFNDLRNIRVDNQSLYRIAKTMSTHYMNNTNEQLRILDNEKEKIISSFDEKTKIYDNKYESLVDSIKESRTTIKSMENRYENKIDIVDSKIDNKKLELDSEYKAWKSNVENNIVNLDNLVIKSKKEMKLLSDNKIIIDKFKMDLALLNKKLSDIEIKLSTSEENNNLDNNRTKQESKKHLIKFEKLQDDVAKNITKVDSIVIKSKKEIQLLNDNKIILDSFKLELELLTKKLSDMCNSLSTAEEKVSPSPSKIEDVNNKKIVIKKEQSE